MTQLYKLQIRLDQMVSDSAEGAVLSEALDSSIWKARDGSVPLLDDPTLQFSAQRWDKPPVFNINTIMNRLQTGQVGPPDLVLTQILLDWRCVTEKQIRHLTRNAFDKGHHIGTRLRTLQKIGWFDGYCIERPGQEKEYIWMLGIAAYQYYSIMHAMKLLDPILMLQFKDYSMSICAVNEMRVLLENRGKLCEVIYAPTWKRGDAPRPFAKFQVQSSKGPLTIYLERLSQKNKPLSLMRKKVDMYERMVAENNGKLPMDEKGASMVIWSVGSIQSIEELVGSIDHLPDNFFQVFLPDECLEEFPASFYLAKKGSREGVVELQKINMDVF